MERSSCSSAIFSKDFPFPKKCLDTFFENVYRCGKKVYARYIQILYL